MKKKIAIGKITGIIMVLIGSLFLISLSGCEEETLKCENPNELSCEQVQKCYNECSEKMIITWQWNCRDKLEVYVWKCFSGLNNS